MYQPLADKIRPKTLDDVVGQQHLLGRNGLLRRVIESGNIPNLIFYGPSGVGKTTVASIIAKQTDRKLYHLNATTAGIADIKAIIDELDTFLAPNGALVYLDEIQYFNKKTAAEPFRVHRDRQDDADRVHDREPLFLYLQRNFEPLHGVRVQAHRGAGHAEGSRAGVHARHRG